MFSEPEIEEVESKLNKNKSRFSAPKKEPTKSFNQVSQEFAQEKMDRSNQLFQLGSKFVKVIRDKTLSENRGPIEKSLEQETLKQLIEFAELLNEEAEEGLQKPSAGSVALLTLLFKVSLVNRDNYNEALFKIERLEKQVLELKSSRNDSK